MNELKKMHKPSFILLILAMLAAGESGELCILFSVISLIMSIKRLNTHKKSEYIIISDITMIIIGILMIILADLHWKRIGIQRSPLL